MSNWHRPAGSAARHGFDVALGPREAGWEHAGLNVLTLAPGERRLIMTSGCEWLVLPLVGPVPGRVGRRRQGALPRGPHRPVRRSDRLRLRPPDVARHGHQHRRCPARAAPRARPSGPLPFRRIPAEECVTELRGAGHSSRQVRNFGTPDVLNADSIIACEVLTPAGNWSSYPPHKHDEEHEGRESELEEIYYFEMRGVDGSIRGRPAVRLPAGLRHAGPADQRDGRGAHTVTSSSCRTAGTVPRWRRPATTCTTSTSWPVPATSASG